MRRVDTRYIITHEGKTFVGKWSGGRVKLNPDERTADEVMRGASDAGWECRYAGIGFGTKTTESICKQIGYDWEPHSLVAKYEE